MPRARVARDGLVHGDALAEPKTRPEVRDRRRTAAAAPCSQAGGVIGMSELAATTTPVSIAERMGHW
jgi:hypothetical protein